MTQTHSKLAWGLRDNTWIHINDAERGRHCHSTCPSCGSPLIAKKGNKNTWHYAHLTNTQCKGETVLHKLGKRAVIDLAINKALLTLPTHIKGNPSAISSYLEKINPTERLINAHEEIARGHFVHDVIAQSENFEELVVEILVTHKKSNKDIALFKQEGKSVIEIDLSGVRWNASYSEIIAQVQAHAPRTWLSHHAEALLSPCSRGSHLLNKLSVSASPAALIKNIENKIYDNTYCCTTLPFLLNKDVGLTQNDILISILHHEIKPLLYNKKARVLADSIKQTQHDNNAVTSRIFTTLCYYFLRCLFQQNILSHLGDNVFVANQSVLQQAM